MSVRTRSAGTWGMWTAFETGSDDAADPASADGKGPGVRAGTEPLWVGPSDGVQVRLTTTAGTPRDVGVELVDPGTAPADSASAPAAPRSTAEAGESRPVIISRKAWGADERIRRGSPSYNATVKVGVIHHTASSSNYTAAQAAAMVRGIYAYHVKGRGWSDVGYNFLVDKYGRTYEGRAGGIDRFVVGAHAGGFNTSTFGVAFLGDYSKAAPPAKAILAAEKVLAWKLASAYRDPAAWSSMRSAGGGTSRYKAGQYASLQGVSAHRQVGYTSCPGTPTFNKLGSIRSAVKALIGAGFADPAKTESGGVVTVTARTLKSMTWQLSVVGPDGAVLRTVSGSGSGALKASWDLTDAAGNKAAPGDYVLRLSGAAGSDLALPWTTTVRVADLSVPLPSGVTARGPDGRLKLVRDGRVIMPTAALLDAMAPTAVVVQGTTAQLALPGAAARAPEGLAGRDPVDGTVRVATGGRVLTLTPEAATVLGYETAELPSLKATEFGWPGAEGVLDTARHPVGTLVRDAADESGRVWLLEADARRLVDPSWLTSYGKKPVLLALPGDPTAVGSPAAPADGAVLRTPDAAVWIVEKGVRRQVTAAAATRLGLRPAEVPATTDALLAATTEGATIG